MRGLNVLLERRKANISCMPAPLVVPLAFHLHVALVDGDGV